MRNKILLSVHDALIDHGPDITKPDMISTALVLVARDLAKKAANPVILRVVSEELASG
jgi:hypothetical protein